MGDAITSTARGTSNILSNRIVVDMSDKITLLKPKEYPLNVMVRKLGKMPCHNYKVEWMEDSLLGMWTAINNGAGYLVGDTSIVVDDGSIIAVNDIIKNVTTDEQMLVTAVATNTLTVTRGYGETAAAAMADNEKILVVGNANMQGGIANNEKNHQPTNVYNYTQIFRDPFSVTNTLEATKLYGKNELARLQAHKAIEHAQHIEHSFIFGERKLDSSGAQPKAVTGGVYTFLNGTAPTKAISKGSGTVNDLLDFCEELFEYGSNTRTMLCSASVITLVNKFALGKLELMQSDMDKTLGLDVVSWLSPFGRINMIQHPLFKQGYTDFALALDMEEIKYRNLQGRDTQLKTNIQNNDEDGRRDEYITEAGLEIRHPEKHGILTLTA